MNEGNIIIKVGDRLIDRNSCNMWLIIVAVNRRGYVVQKWMMDKFNRKFPIENDIMLMKWVDIYKYYDIEEFQRRERNLKLNNIL